MGKYHKWSLDEEDIIYANRHLSARHIKDRFFNEKNDISLQAISDKLSRIVDEREQANHGKPWTSEDIDYLRQVVERDKAEKRRTPNSDLKIRLKRGSKELDQAYFDIKHHGKINKKRATKKSIQSDAEKYIDPIKRKLLRQLIQTGMIEEASEVMNQIMNQVLNNNMINQLENKPATPAELAEFKKYVNNRWIEDALRLGNIRFAVNNAFIEVWLVYNDQVQTNGSSLASYKSCLKREMKRVGFTYFHGGYRKFI